MPNYTDNLELFKYDVEADKKSTFNIGLALNDNFDKIDAKVGEMETQQANIDLSNLSTTGNSKLNAKANIDLSNLSTTGEKRFEDINTQIAKTVLQSDLYDSNGYIKIDRILTSKYSSGTSWYRVYSDGWIEQGGRVTGKGFTTAVVVTLLKTFTNTQYSATVTNASNQMNYVEVGCGLVSNTKLNVYGQSNHNIIWRACGY